MIASVGFSLFLFNQSQMSFEAPDIFVLFVDVFLPISAVVYGSISI